MVLLRMDDIPKIEKAKSSRSSCRTCKQKIIKDIYRIGIPYQFTKPDGDKIISYGWHHPECVPFSSIPAVLNIINEDLVIDPEDKEDIISSINKTEEEQETILKQPYIELSKSSRGKCQKCEEKIKKDVYRVAEPSEVELEDGRRFFSNKFSHLKCFLDSTSNTSVIFKQLIGTSLKRKTIASRAEAELLEKRLSKIIKTEGSTEEVLRLIGDDPIKVDTLKTLAKEKGIDFDLVKKVIEKALLQGTLFELKPGLIQKM